jgi:hypothetical protein
MNEIVAIIESIVNGTKEKRMHLNSVGGVVGNNHRNQLSAWQLRTRLVQCTTLGRLRIVRTGANENVWEVQLLPMSDDNAGVGVSNGHVDYSAVGAAVEAYARKMTKNAQGAKQGQGGSLPVLSVGGVMCSSKQCTAKVWRALVAALKQGRVGNIVMEMPTTDQGSWRIRVVDQDDMSADDDDPLFARAIVYSIAFVGAHPLCHIDVLGANVGSYYGSAIWQRVKGALIRSGSERQTRRVRLCGGTMPDCSLWTRVRSRHAPTHQRLCHCHESSLFKRRLCRCLPLSPPAPAVISAALVPPKPLIVDEPVPTPLVHQSVPLVKPEPAARTGTASGGSCPSHRRSLCQFGRYVSGCIFDSTRAWRSRR